MFGPFMLINVLLKVHDVFIPLLIYLFIPKCLIELKKNLMILKL